MEHDADVGQRGVDPRGVRQVERAPRQAQLIGDGAHPVGRAPGEHQIGLRERGRDFPTGVAIRAVEQDALGHARSNTQRARPARKLRSGDGGRPS